MIVNPGIGLASAVTQGLEPLSNRTAIEADESKLRLQKATTDAQNDPELIKAQLDATQAELKAISGKQAQQETYKAFRSYVSDFNVHPINQLLKTNPMVRQAWRGIAAVEPINPAYDQRLLNQAGVTEYKAGRHVKAIMPDGSQQLLDMQNMMIGTGFLSPSSGLNRNEIEWLVQETELFDTKSTHAPGGLEKDSRYLSGLGIGSEQDVANSLFRERTMGNVAGQLEEGDKVLESMLNAFGGEDEFFKTDMTLQENRTTAHPYMAKYMAYTKQKINAKDSADLKEIGTLVKLAEITEENLTPEATGKLDSWTRQFGKYLSNEVDEIDQTKAVSAYEQFRNVMRHAFFGAALTPTEIANFNNAFGTIGQKYPHVVTQFLTALQSTRSKISTLYNLNDPYMAHYYFGNNASKLDSVISAFEDRITLLQEYQKKYPDKTPVIGDNTEILKDAEAKAERAKPKPSGKSVQPDVKSKLDGIWKTR